MKVIKPKEPAGPKIPPVPRSDFDFNRHYWELVCGHFTDLDTDTMFRSQSSPRDKLWCDTCGKWRKPVPKPKYVAPPTEPLF